MTVDERIFNMSIDEYFKRFWADNAPFSMI